MFDVSRVKKIFFGCVTFVFLLFATGCVKYSPAPLQRPAKKAVQERGGVQVGARMLSDRECKHHFGRRVHHKGYEVIQISITNNTNSPYVLDGRDVSLELESSALTAKNLHFNTKKRVLFWGLGALFIWPLIIPAVVDGINSSDANRKMNCDFERNVIDSNSLVTVQPGCHCQQGVFCPS